MRSGIHFAFMPFLGQQNIMINRFRSKRINTLSHTFRWCSSSSSLPFSTNDINDTAHKSDSIDSSNAINSSSSSSSTNLLKYFIPSSSATMGAPRPMHDAKASHALSILSSFPPTHIRNFAFVAHVDHGKTTLSDAVLRRTGVLQGALVGAYTDRLLVERERGITVKAQTCSIFVTYNGEEYLLNLIDTPGHVDFQYEVSRSLSASEAALLLVDVAQGIEAQTMAHFHSALDRGLTIIPVLTKLDTVLDDIPVEKTLQELEDSTGLLRREVLFTSAKEQLGVEEMLRAIIERVPPPTGVIGLSDTRQLPPVLPDSKERIEMEDKLVPLRALIFDSWTSECGGGLRRVKTGNENNSNNNNNNNNNANIDDNVICLVRIIDGTLTPKTIVSFYHSQKRSEVREVGIIHPELRPTTALTTGMVGYVVFSQLHRDDFSVGETLYTLPTRKFYRESIIPVTGFKRVHPVVFAGFYPDEGEYITQLREAVEKLRVNEPAVTLETLECPALGSGLQLGFLGMLHMQVFQERLLAEFGQRVLVTPPLVQYKYRATGDATEHSLSVHTWRWPHEGVECYLEPFVTATIVTRREYFQLIDSEALRRFRGEQLEMRVMDDARVMLRYKMPLSDLVRGFFSTVKSLSRGYASLDYDDLIYAEADLVKVDIVVQKSRVSALSVICPRHEAADVGKRIVSSLKSNLTRSAIDIPLQAIVGTKIIARETVKAYRKDVTAKIHAGDISRKQKKWNDQKKGKERMARRTVGSVTLDQSILAAAMGATML